MADDIITIEVGEMLGASRAAALREAILTAGPADLDLDLAGADQVSTRSLQVLLSAAITARAGGRRLALKGGEGLSTWLAQAGLTLNDLQASPIRTEGVDGA